MVRHVLRCRAVSHFVGQTVKLRELFDRAFDRNRIDEIGEAGRCLFLDAIEAAGGAVALKRSHVAGEAGFVEEARHVFQCKGILLSRSAALGRAHRVGVRRALSAV